MSMAFNRHNCTTVDRCRMTKVMVGESCCSSYMQAKVMSYLALGAPPSPSCAACHPKQHCSPVSHMPVYDMVDGISLQVMPWATS